jgi:hypothetical protein
MKRILFGIAALAGAVTLAPPAFAQPAADHLACYRVRDSARRGRFTLTLTNAGVTQSCSIGARAQLGCLETQKSDVVPTPPGGGPSVGNAGDFLCYKLFCPRPFPPAAQTTDQFGGTRIVTYKAAQFLCAPATRGPETNPPPRSTTTTLAPGPCSFSSNDQRCEGTCGNGGHCSAVTSAADCQCRTTACGDASAPDCNGFCEAGEYCTFNLTGCRCVRIT